MLAQEKYKKENKTEVLPPVRVTKSELDLFKEKSAEAGVSLSNYTRELLHNGHVINPINILDVKSVIKLSEIGNSLKYIAPISNNLNQLVRKTHIHDETDIEQMHLLLEHLNNVEWTKLKNDLENIVSGLVHGS